MLRCRSGCRESSPGRALWSSFLAAGGAVGQAGVSPDLSSGTGRVEHVPQRVLPFFLMLKPEVCLGRGPWPQSRSSTFLPRLGSGLWGQPLPLSSERQ